MQKVRPIKRGRRSDEKRLGHAAHLQNERLRKLLVSAGLRLMRIRVLCSLASPWWADSLHEKDTAQTWLERLSRRAGSNIIQSRRNYSPFPSIAGFARPDFADALRLQQGQTSKVSLKACCSDGRDHPSSKASKNDQIFIPTACLFWLLNQSKSQRLRLCLGLDVETVGGGCCFRLGVEAAPMHHLCRCVAF